MKVKCLIFCLLSAALLAGFSISSKAAEEEALMEEVSALRPEEEYGVQHIHVFKVPVYTPDDSYVKGAGKYINSKQCYHATKVTLRCTGCAQTLTRVEVSYAIKYDHEHTSTWNVRCDGVKQTHFKRCASCHYNNGTYRIVDCPGGPHSGGCDYLPMGHVGEHLPY